VYEERIGTILKMVISLMQYINTDRCNPMNFAFLVSNFKIKHPVLSLQIALQHFVVYSRHR